MICKISKILIVLAWGILYLLFILWWLCLCVSADLSTRAAWSDMTAKRDSAYFKSISSPEARELCPKLAIYSDNVLSLIKTCFKTQHTILRSKINVAAIFIDTIIGG